jgi:hypothetical protein
MRLDKIAQLANILAVIPGVYSAYAAYVLLHPQAVSTSPQSSPVGLPSMTGLTISLGAFAACIIIGGVLNTVAMFRKPQVAARADDRQILQTTRTPTADGRIFVDVTPAYLGGLFEGHTDIQAQKLIQPFVGKWMEISGKLGEVSEGHGFLQVTLQSAYPLVTILAVRVYMHFHVKWTDRLSVLRQGDALTIVGQIDRVDKLSVVLRACELVSTGISTST